LLPSQTQEICKVNLIEKLLATVLAKLSNFIPEAGIWLNTQRPEWNDANNALVGNGVSMVTLYYLQRFLNFFEEIVENTSVNNVSISEEMVMLFKEIVSTFEKNKHLLSGKISDADRKTVVDQLGLAGSHYRTTIYEKGFTSHKSVINKNELSQFFGLTKKFIDHTINANKRADNLFHSYNLMTIENEQEISISYLPEMLEGQVSVLSSGHLSPTDSLALLNSLRKSALYRKDQNSYILYPNKQLKRFIDKNNIPAEAIEKSELVKQLLKNGNSQIIEKDVLGNCHFNGNFNNANSLKFALGALPYSYQKLVEKDQGLLLTTFENIFNHKSFTGRSGTFFGYEGLGSIYWHMVSKLALAVEETCLNAIESGAENEIIAELRNHYHEITEGIGVHKSPEVYGAFPTDPYSHTPGGKGAQQPGMTGQVKEDFLARMTELGVSVTNGTVKFQPYLLKIEEFLKERKTVHFTDVNLRKKELMLEKNSLFFTYCQVPVVYKLADKNTIQVIYSDEKSIEIEGLSLDKKNSELVFQRNGRIANIIVSFQKNGEFLNISKN
jgi:hypothetical protein